MIHLSFSLQLVELFVDHRTQPLVHLAEFVSFFGSAPCYAFLTLFLFVAWDKRLAIRVSALILLTMSLNDTLKLLIAHPRPFLAQGTYRQKWAVSPREASRLAAEYSTPSGHAMGSSAFYPYLASLTRNRFVRILLVLLVVLIGISRPYLGVHYVEDILLGWAIGLSIAFLAIRHGNRLSGLWSRLSHPSQIATAVGASFALFALAVLCRGGVDNQIRELVSNCGFFSGIAIAYPLELRYINFNPRSGRIVVRIVRFVVTIAIFGIVLFGLKLAFRHIESDVTSLGCALEYLRYVAANVAAMFSAPVIFCRISLAEALPDAEPLIEVAR